MHFFFKNPFGSVQLNYNDWEGWTLIDSLNFGIIDWTLLNFYFGRFSTDVSNCYFRLINLYVYSVDESSICRFSFERGSNELDRFIPRPTEAGIWGSTTAAAFVVLPDLVQFSPFHARERNQIKTFFFPNHWFLQILRQISKI